MEGDDAEVKADGREIRARPLRIINELVIALAIILGSTLGLIKIWMEFKGYACENIEAFKSFCSTPTPIVKPLAEVSLPTQIKPNLNESAASVPVEAPSTKVSPPRYNSNGYKHDVFYCDKADKASFPVSVKVQTAIRAQGAVANIKKWPCGKISFVGGVEGELACTSEPYVINSTQKKIEQAQRLRNYLNGEFPSVDFSIQLVDSEIPDYLSVVICLDASGK